MADDATLRVMVRGTSLEAATAAVQGVGLGLQQSWELVDIVVAVGTAAQVQALRAAPGVVYVEGEQPLAFTLETAHEATRSNEALATLTAADGSAVDGSGISIAVIDSGIDSTHPMFATGLGTSKVVNNLKNVCGIAILGDTCFVGGIPDTDTLSAGGHGTHVAGIAAGQPVTTILPAGAELRGAASDAKLVGLSVGASLSLIDAVAAQNWVLEHQQNPCRSVADQSTTGEVDADCPPIRVTNHSYGPAATQEGGNKFNEDAADVQVQRALVEKGVVAVWAAGNSAGNGSQATTNPAGMDPTPGILSVASYNDNQTGDRDFQLSSFSSRGELGRTGSYPDLSAPGDGITSACRAYLTVCSTGLDPIDGGNYNTISGTSMAAPYVAGVVAQLLEANPALTPAQLEDVLEDSAYSFEAGGGYEADPLNADSETSFDKGHGLVDVLAALQLATPTTTSTTQPGTTTRSNVSEARRTGAPGRSKK